MVFDLSNIAIKRYVIIIMTSVICLLFCCVFVASLSVYCFNSLTHKARGIHRVCSVCLQAPREAVYVEFGNPTCRLADNKSFLR